MPTTFAQCVRLFYTFLGTERNENKFKSIPLSNFEEALREPPSCGYKSNNKTNNPYLYFTLKASDSNKGSNSKHKNDSMDFKTTTSSECEKWVHALRELLKTCTLKIEKVENVVIVSLL